MEWLHGFIVPLIEIIFIGGIILYVGYWVVKGFHNAWTKQTKFFFKFKVMRKQYPETTLKWCLDCIDNGIGYYDAKKLLMVKMIPDAQVNETMFIYDEILKTMKGGLDKNDRRFKASDRKDQSQTELPTIQ